MLLNESIKNCELEYIKCFSDYYEGEHFIRFNDNKLVDMYKHNYTYIKEDVNESNLGSIIEDEIKLRLSQGMNFCNISINNSINQSTLSNLDYKGEVARNGYYLFNTSYLSKLDRVEGSSVLKVTDKDMVNDILYCDLQHDEVNLGVDFCKRRCYRRGEVYISEHGVNSYVCYNNGEVIGNCDLFINNGVAKIEDFAVVPKHQRRGYGTTILKSLIEIAMKENCNTIYLVTDEDDTAKDMYQKIGFNKIGETTDIFFKL